MFETPPMLQDAQEPIWVAGCLKGLDVDIQCVRPPNESNGHSKIDWAPVQPPALHLFPFQ